MKHKPKSGDRKGTPEHTVEKTDVLVSVADDHMDKIYEVEKHLKAVGLDATQVMATSGVISGSVAVRQFHKLSKVPGVSAVERSQAYRIPPPSSDIQ